MSRADRSKQVFRVLTFGMDLFEETHKLILVVLDAAISFWIDFYSSKITSLYCWFRYRLGPGTRIKSKITTTEQSTTSAFACLQ